MRSPHLDRSARRVAFLRAVLFLVFAGLALRAAHLSVVDERGSDLGDRQGHSVLTLAPERGTVFDRTGSELALTVDAPSVYAVPAALEDVDATARKLAPVLGLDRRELRERLRRRRAFVFLSRWVAPEQARALRDLDLPGIGLLDEPRRTYPHKELSASVVGFANIDGRGVRGIEQQEEDWLRGRPRRIPVERDGSGRLLLMESEDPWSTAGGDVALTLDATMQADAMVGLQDAMRRTGARGGIVLSMDPRSGDVLALAEAPSFDPNRFREVTYASTRSRAFLDAIEPGSAMKPFVVAAALETGAIGQDDLIDCEGGSWRIPGKTIRDLKPHGWLGSAEILRVSSNIGAVKIAFALGARAHYEMLRRFGFGIATGSGFPEESAGLLRSDRGWRPVDHATIAFGQGVSVTPVQLAAATSALANGGEWVRPRLVAAHRPPGGDWRHTIPEVLRRVVAPETAAAIRAMLADVTGPGGTGRRAALAGVPVAGKTGTAQKFDARAGRYSGDRFVAWFIGMAPAASPRLVVVVALDEPRRPTHTGGAAAAPLFARVAAAQLARLGILTEPRPSAARTPAVAAGPPPRARTPLPEVVRMEGRVLMPDLLGLGVDEVREITAKHDLEVEISGSGRAIAQDPPPGTVVAEHGVRIRVRFEKGGGQI
jgi:cell division protein FtsI (penicillin-binding protein 3)